MNTERTTGKTTERGSRVEIGVLIIVRSPGGNENEDRWIAFVSNGQAQMPTKEMVGDIFRQPEGLEPRKILQITDGSRSTEIQAMEITPKQAALIIQQTPSTRLQQGGTYRLLSVLETAGTSAQNIMPGVREALNVFYAGQRVFQELSLTTSDLINI
ncbi:MAG: hypothetical protein A2700_02990 [Candidatus Blackburnbacteria bacterium RIFCSPHIGHO2_01_FULL_44_64]|uniref:Uncharacterized protein n=1 Tax=Candidatus Blackburnbacteria bacterium RIFCSPHIGHO2_02_FULL_44_20 TaxID=1797516 RepID=A0A1G1V4R5_9BACT|nr:MAG: hypothetical protein A2700_02990 [Candidatus Blackburnbacteria bacterium RIFCSPHIGHO2_01_FULL_44_64]OGY10390.1 MAG: hypothetical protein A3D26_03710 [Candidatus Blackburnbacteria bacterium RIFCSPHIGHO2_02_FULL_44_20]OGY12100.1 MAG: hypothetical protein A3E16_00075 [Candidatus Blackburnbacteria bacterium RIFCSPHIGHO2_12_FULL_44_25]OGY13717.1 MAG: hypothetical protein A3A62_02800 [Candidatus Blackburnbacteria bacterium RIFCSPLOWO2_01_FULL_44_43]OGY17127.1 MAG: hypothetical protein A3H88_0